MATVIHSDGPAREKSWHENIRSYVGAGFVCHSSNSRQGPIPTPPTAFMDHHGFYDGPIDSLEIPQSASN